MKKINKELYKAAALIVISETEKEINQAIDSAESITGKMNHGDKVDLFDLACDYLTFGGFESEVCEDIYSRLLSIDNRNNIKVARPVGTF